MQIKLEKIPCFGVVGNFTGHLEQAGEATDFLKIATKENNEPKAIFPTYIPGNSTEVPFFLHTFPFNAEKIIFPTGEEKLQIEPECAIICNVKWKDNKIVELNPFAFGASNDCSIRKQGAKKISLKKNWGKLSKGLSSNLIPIDKFTESGILDHYRIASFLIRENKVHIYGKNSSVKDYSYIYEKLINWCIEKFNNQKAEGPAEDIHKYLIESEKPEMIMISIGATCYTSFGENNFLKNKDIATVVLYPDSYSEKEIENIITSNNFTDRRISILKQMIVLE